MVNPFTRKLELFGPLPDDDKRLLEGVVWRTRQVAAATDIVREGDRPSDCHVVLDGFACRYKILPDGQRHIFAYLIPGDMCDVHGAILKVMDHGIQTLSPCTIVNVPQDTVLEMLRRPEIARALWWSTLVDEAVLREWLVNLGQRDAEERIAHLFCELHLRLQSIGLTSNGNFELPITQIDLADTMGLSTVHANRSLQTLRAKGLIQFSGGHLAIPNVRALRAVCGFNPNYLHLKEGDRDDALLEKSTPA